MSEAVDPRAALAAVNELADLLIERRRRPLDPAGRQRFDLLEERVRAAVDGARTPARRAAATAPEPAASPTLAQASSPTSSRASAPATAPRAAAARAVGLGVVEEAVQLSKKDRGKLKGELRLSDLPRSGYTPPAMPAFLADYYSENMVPSATAPAGAPVSVVTADGDEAAALHEEALTLLGLAGATVRKAPSAVAPAPPAAPSAPSPSAVTPAPPAAPERTARPNPARSAPRPPAGRGETPVIVHLISGNILRGAVDRFDPGSGAVTLLPRADGEVEQAVELREVLAIFFGPGRDGQPTPPGGPTVVVRLVNDRQITGSTPDYAEGAASLTVIPEPRRPNLDRVWIPAWAVKGIELVEG